MESDKPTMSQSIGKLAAALSAAQGMMQSAKADSENPFFKSKYADLASVWESCRKPLAENKLAVVQTLGGAPDAVEIITTLLHESGEWIRGTIILRPVKADPQGIGSTITYGRRYGLAAILGIVQEDDDGNEASRPPKATQPKESPKKAEKSQHYNPETKDNPHEMPQKVAETPVLKVIPNNPMPYTQTKDKPQDAPETASVALRIPERIIEKLAKSTIDDAFDIIMDVAMSDEQLDDLKKIVLRHCPEYFETDRATIPGSTIAQIIKDASGVEMKPEE